MGFSERIFFIKVPESDFFFSFIIRIFQALLESIVKLAEGSATSPSLNTDNSFRIFQSVPSHIGKHLLRQGESEVTFSAPSTGIAHVRADLTESVNPLS